MNGGGTDPGEREGAHEAQRGDEEVHLWATVLDKVSPAARISERRLFDRQVPVLVLPFDAPRGGDIETSVRCG